MRAVLAAAVFDPVELMLRCPLGKKEYFAGAGRR
jgi:hypothetical protein